MSESTTERVIRIEIARAVPLNLLLDTLGSPQHVAIRQVLYTRQHAIMDFFDSNHDNRIHHLELFEHCNQQIKLALGL